MNKLFIMAAAVGVALTACTNEAEEGLNVGGQDKISFATPVVAPNTRAAVPGEIGTNYAFNQKFSVFAVWTPEKFATWAEGTKFMNDVEVYYQPNQTTPKKKTFAPAQDYYWPKNGYLTFAAYSPSSVNATYGAAGLTVENFTVEASGYTQDEQNTGTALDGVQYDFMYAPRVKDQTNSNFTKPEGNEFYDGVNILFKHALSSVQFTVRTAANYPSATINVKYIALNGIQNKGKFEEVVTDQAAYAAAPKWTNASDTTGYVAYTTLGEKVIWNSGKGMPILGNKFTDGKGLILLPQSFVGNNDAKLTVVWSMKSATGDEIEQKNVIALKDIEFTAGKGTAAEWKMGYRYTYNIIFGLDKIYFAPSCDAWDDATGADVNPGYTNKVVTD